MLRIIPAGNGGQRTSCWHCCCGMVMSQGIVLWSRAAGKHHVCSSYGGWCNSSTQARCCRAAARRHEEEQVLQAHTQHKHNVRSTVNNNQCVKMSRRQDAGGLQDACGGTPQRATSDGVSSLHRIAPANPTLTPPRPITFSSPPPTTHRAAPPPTPNTAGKHTRTCASTNRPQRRYQLCVGTL